MRSSRIEIMITGIRAVSGADLSWPRTLQPSTRGIMTSSVITSGAARTGELNRLLAVIGMQQAIAFPLQRILEQVDRTDSSSSTTRTVSSSPCGRPGAGTSFGCGGRLLPPASGSASGSGMVKVGALARFALDGDLPAHHLAELLADGQAEAGAAVLAGGRASAWVKAWNSRPSCSGVMPMPVSRHAKTIAVAAVVRGSRRSLQRDRSVLRELARRCSAG